MIFRQQDIPDDTGPKITAPRQVANRREVADRERYAGSFYFDAIDLTEEDDRRNFRGNAMTGRQALYQLPEYGRSYQLGMNVDFY